MRIVESLLLVSLLIGLAAPSPASACGCQKKALQSMLKLQEEAERMQLPSQSLRKKAKALDSAGKMVEAQTAFNEAANTALAESRAIEAEYKAGKKPYSLYRFSLMHAAEVQKERGRMLDQRHDAMAYKAYEDAVQLELQAGLTPEEMEYTYQTLITLLITNKQYAKAEPYAQQLLAYRETEGKFTPQVGQSMRTYAMILRKLGRPDEAKQYEMQSRAIAASGNYMN